MKRKNFYLFLLSIIICSATLSAEFKFYYQDGFESSGGAFPENLRHSHHSTPLTTRVVSWGQIPQAGLIFDQTSAPVIGNYGIEMRPLETDPHLSVVDPRYLDRTRLGENGRALFQVDFFYPGGDESNPTMAILANSSYKPDEKSYKFYRFGIDRDRIYFSFTNQKSSPDIYERQDISEFDLQRGWHRLQIIFEGQNQILCAIDGQVTSFSPITDDTLTSLEPGLMVTRGKNTNDMPVYADNLQILWSMSNSSPIPQSPWALNVSAGSGDLGLRANPWTVGGLGWYNSPSEAWNEAKAQQRIIFAAFYSNQGGGKEKLLNLIGSESAAPILSRCILLRSDVGESSGKVFADRYNITQFPAFATINIDGSLMNWTPVTPDMTWEQVFGNLSGN